MTDRTNHRTKAEWLLTDAYESTEQVGELTCVVYAAVHALLAIHDTLTDLKPNPLTVTHPWSNPLTVIHPWPSTLTDVDAADRYAANEEQQREDIPEPDPLDESDHRDRLDADGDIWVRNPGGCWHRRIRDCRALDCGWTLAYLDDHIGPLTFAPEAECSRCGELYAGTAEATLDHHRACTGETPQNPMGDPLDESDHRDRLDNNGLRVKRMPSGYWVWVGAEEVGGWALEDINRYQGPLTFAP